MSNVFEEYKRIYETFNPENYDQRLVDKHIKDIEGYAEKTQSMIAIYNNVSDITVYASKYYQEYFSSEWEGVHPDDHEAIVKSSVIALRYFFRTKAQIRDHRLIRRYRFKIFGEYKVVIEQNRPLEIDSDGCVWLSLITIDIAPNQSPPHRVDYKIFNYKTADIIAPVDTYLDGEPILSKREIEILRLIEMGLLSKEISEKLSISINTVSKHRQRILEKLNVNSSIEAIKYANAMGVL